MCRLLFFQDFLVFFFFRRTVHALKYLTHNLADCFINLCGNVVCLPIALTKFVRLMVTAVLQYIFQVFAPVLTEIMIFMVGGCYPPAAMLAEDIAGQHRLTLCPYGKLAFFFIDLRPLFQNLVNPYCFFVTDNP